MREEMLECLTCGKKTVWQLETWKIGRRTKLRCSTAITKVGNTRTGSEGPEIRK